jgi:hypothetical protein
VLRRRVIDKKTQEEQEWDRGCIQEVLRGMLGRSS